MQWGMGISRWIIVDRYDYGHHSTYVGPEKWIDFQKVWDHSRSYLPIKGCVNELNAGLHRHTVSLLSKHHPHEIINSPPFLPDFWCLQEIPDRTHDLRPRRDWILDFMYYGRLCGVLVYRKILELLITGSMHRRS